MTESTESQSRFSSIRKAVETAENLGITDPALRREAVINAISAEKKGIIPISEEEARWFPSVAELDIRKESEEVVETAINKYLEIKEGLPRIPVLVDAIHAQKPAPSEGAPEEWDANTKEITQRVADLTGASLIISKKSRMKADLNRAWWTRETRSGVEPKEFPRSARAALYWSVRKILLNTGRLDENEQLKDNFYRIAIHGMKDHENYDFAIAGSQGPANEEFITWFTEKFKESLVGVGVEPKVVIAKLGDKETEAYSGTTSLTYFRRTPKKDYLIQHPAFGLKFQTIQLEIGNKIRKDLQKREMVSLALANVIKELE